MRNKWEIKLGSRAFSSPDRFCFDHSRSILKLSTFITRTHSIFRNFLLYFMSPTRSSLIRRQAECHDAPFYTTAILVTLSISGTFLSALGMSCQLLYYTGRLPHACCLVSAGSELQTVMVQTLRVDDALYKRANAPKPDYGLYERKSALCPSLTLGMGFGAWREYQ